MGEIWKLEDVGCDDPELSFSDQKALTIQNDSIQLKGGHNALDIPFKCIPPGLMDNKSLVQYKLQLLHKHLLRDKTLKARYTTEICKLFENGHAKLVPSKDLE